MEKNILSESVKNIIILVACSIALASLVYAKSFEYRPIVINYRTVALSTAYQPSTSRAVSVSIICKINCTSTLAGGQDGTVSLQISPDNITYTTVASLENSNSVSLAIAITAANSNQGALVGTVAPGYYYKLITTSTTGAPTFTIITQSQETSL